MAVASTPLGDVTPRPEEIEDVNLGSDSSTEEADTAAEKPEEKSDEQIGEDDIAALKEQRKVPYNRFKEVNEAKKTLQAELDDYRDKLKSTVEDYEVRLAAQSKVQKSPEEQLIDQYSDDSLSYDSQPSNAEIGKLQSTITQLQNTVARMQDKANEADLNSHIDSLQNEFADADKLEVLGWAKASGAHKKADIAELMEKSHNKLLARTEAKMQQVIQAKKAKAKASIPTRPGGVRLKDEERPKTLQEAHRMIARFGSKLVGR